MALLASSFEEIENVIAEWEAYAGPERGKPAKKRKSARDRLRPITDSDGNLIYLGRTGPQNDRVTFDIAGPGRLVAPCPGRAWIACHRAGERPRTI